MTFFQRSTFDWSTPIQFLYLSLNNSNISWLKYFLFASPLREHSNWLFCIICKTSYKKISECLLLFHQPCLKRRELIDRFDRFWVGPVCPVLATTPQRSILIGSLYFTPATSHEKRILIGSFYFALAYSHERRILIGSFYFVLATSHEGRIITDLFDSRLDSYVSSHSSLRARSSPTAPQKGTQAEGTVGVWYLSVEVGSC